MTKLTKTGFIFLAFLLAGCAHLSKDRAATPQPPTKTSATIWDSSNQRWIDEADLNQLPRSKLRGMKVRL